MATTTTSQLTKRLPPELLEKVLAHTSVRDILGMKRVRKLYHQRVQGFQLNHLLCQVNRGFNDIIQTSPYIKYRLDLLDAGLEDNPAVNLSLAEKRRAFDEYRAKWYTLSPIQKQRREIDDFTGYTPKTSGSGVFVFLVRRERLIQFVSLKSVSRGIP